jgi:hypothetical protein
MNADLPVERLWVFDRRSSAFIGGQHHLCRSIIYDPSTNGASS